MPEYNHGYTAPLKNAIDYLHDEWFYKPVGLVSYGGVAGGTRAVADDQAGARGPEDGPRRGAVVIPFVGRLINDDGQLDANEAMEQAAAAMLVELQRVEAALRTLRVEV